MIFIHRKEHFNAAHQLWNPHWSEKKNYEVFGVCANPNFHGHNFEITVTVAGIPNINTGFIIDMKKLGDIINEYVCEPLDHKNINLDVPFMKGKLASCENLIVEIWKILDEVIKNNMSGVGGLYKLHLTETPKNFVTYYGPSNKNTKNTVVLN